MEDYKLPIDKIKDFNKIIIQWLAACCSNCEDFNAYDLYCLNEIYDEVTERFELICN